jgi:hypothetical protein
MNEFCHTGGYEVSVCARWARYVVRCLFAQVALCSVGTAEASRSKHHYPSLKRKTQAKQVWVAADAEGNGGVDRDDYLREKPLNIRRDKWE